MIKPTEKLLLKEGKDGPKIEIGFRRGIKKKLVIMETPLIQEKFLNYQKTCNFC